MATLAAPKSVSPLIKTARWGALLLGVLYGSSRMKYLKGREVEIQKRENKIKEEIAVRKEAMRIQAEKVEMLSLAKEAGVKPAE